MDDWLTHLKQAWGYHSSIQVKTLLLCGCDGASGIHVQGLYTHCSAIVLPKHRLVQVGEQLLLNVEQHLLVKQRGRKAK